MARQRARSQLGEAIHAVRVAAGLSQQDLAVALDVAQPRISDWEAGQPDVERALDTLAEIERVCGRPRGHILRRAGYMADGPIDARTALADDPHLDEAARESVLEVYEVFRRRSNPDASVSHIAAR